MPRSRYALLAVLGLAIAAPVALAQQSSPDPGSPPPTGRHRAQGLRRCLAALDLSADQKTEIRSIVSENRDVLRADLDALRADREQLRSHLAAGADKSVLGQDVLNEDAHRAKLRGDREAMHEQIRAKLTPDQQSQLSSCGAEPSSRSSSWNSRSSDR